MQADNGIVASDRNAWPGPSIDDAGRIDRCSPTEVVRTIVTHDDADRRFVGYVYTVWLMHKPASPFRGMQDGQLTSTVH